MPERTAWFVSFVGELVLALAAALISALMSVSILAAVVVS